MNKDFIKHFIDKNNRTKWFKEYGINMNIFDKIYFAEYISKIIVNSKYKNYFIFKGGFYLTELIKNNIRTTNDIDLDFTRNISDDLIKEIFDYIAKVALQDGVIIKIKSIDEIIKWDDKKMVKTLKLVLSF